MTWWGKVFLPEALPALHARASRWRSQASAKEARRSGSRTASRLMSVCWCFRADRRRFSVLLVATNQKSAGSRQPAVQSFLDSLQLGCSAMRPSLRKAGQSQWAEARRHGPAAVLPESGWDSKPIPATMSRIPAGTPFMPMARSSRIFRAPDFVGFNRETSKVRLRSEELLGPVQLCQRRRLHHQARRPYPEVLLERRSGQTQG